MSELTIVTYGGADILKNLFNAIAMLFNSGKGGLVQPIAIVTASIGGIWALSKAFFSNSTEGILVGYLLPLIAIPGLLMVPTSSVHIEDVLTHKSYKVDHVPWILAKFSEFTSSFGFRITEAIERVMHTPRDISYNSTGMLFGSETALDISRYRINDANMEANLKRFAKQCILYDLALGRYSIDEIKKSTDLWDFLKNHTSKVRMITYTDSKNKNDLHKAEYLTCTQALNKMTPIFEKEKRYYANHEMLKYLPLTFQALTGLQKDQEDLISQQLVMNVLSGEFGGKQFAKGSAQAHQRSTYQIMGSLASTSLVTMRTVLEALIYGAFIFVLPLAFLPGGIKFISTWLWTAVWIQLWPPFYAILNYIMHSVSLGHSESIMLGLTVDQQGLSIFTSIGLQNLHEDIFALSGYLAASIPFISYAILQGGVQSFIYMAGSMMTPAHSAATTAASEQSSGNYSLANTSFGQTDFSNSSAFQHNNAPSLSSGYFTQNDGDLSITYGSETIVREANSDLRTSFFSDDSISQNLQQAHQKAQTAVESSQRSYSESVSNHSRNMYDLSEHLSKSQNFDETMSSREALDVQESARYLQDTSESWGNQYGLSTKESMDALVSASCGLWGWFESKASVGRGVNEDEMLNSAFNVVSSQDFQKNYQKIKDFSESQSHSALSEEGVRLVEGFTKSLDEVKSSQDQYQASLSTMHQTSENLSWSTNNSQSVKHSLNQDFVNWASAEYSDQGGFSKTMDVMKNGTADEKAYLTSGFINHMRECHSSNFDGEFQNVESAYNQMIIPQVSSGETFSAMKSHAYEESLNGGLDSDYIKGQKEMMTLEKNYLDGRYQNNLDSKKDQITNRSNFIKNKLEHEQKSGKVNAIIHGPQNVMKPIWLE